jgi:hypothetical protein
MLKKIPIFVASLKYNLYRKIRYGVTVYEEERV